MKDPDHPLREKRAVDLITHAYFNLGNTIRVRGLQGNRKDDIAMLRLIESMIQSVSVEDEWHFDYSNCTMRFEP